MTKDNRWVWLREAAQSGGKARQAALSTKERIALATKASRARFKGMTEAERSEALRKVVQARWAKHRAATKKPKPSR